MQSDDDVAYPEHSGIKVDSDVNFLAHLNEDKRVRLWQAVQSDCPLTSASMVDVWHGFTRYLSIKELLGPVSLVCKFFFEIANEPTHLSSHRLLSIQLGLLSKFCSFIGVGFIKLTYADGTSFTKGDPTALYKPFDLEDDEWVTEVHYGQGEVLDGVRFVTSRGRISQQYGGDGGSRVIGKGYFVGVNCGHHTRSTYYANNALEQFCPIFLQTMQ